MKRQFFLLQIFLYDDGDGVSFFSGGTARHPDPERISSFPLLEDAGNYFFVKDFIKILVAKKVCDVDEKVIIQFINFFLLLVSMMW